MTITILQGDWIEQLRTLPDCSVHCCVTSPPYWGLRDYGVPGQLGLENTPDEYVTKLIEGFREVRRLIRDDGTLWLNLGDSYAGGGNNRGNHSPLNGKQASNRGATGQCCEHAKNIRQIDGLKPKDLVGIPWRVAFALQADGWYLRSEIIWAKRNCMPESVEDRPTKSHEQIFLLSKSENYYYDAEAVKQPASESYANDSRWDTGSTELNYKDGYADAMAQNPKMPHRVFNGERRTTVNLRDVWHLTAEPYKESHFATFPTEIPRRAILAGTSAKGCCPKCGASWKRIVEQTPPPKCHRNPPRPRMPGNDQMAAAIRSNGDNWNGPELAAWKSKNPPTETWQATCDCLLSPENVKLVPCTVLDPFGGSGTTGQVALELGRKAILIELNPKYIPLIEARTNITPGLQLA